jgi:hypothetical protein
MTPTKEKLKALVACDFLSNGKRRFTFTPINNLGKSVAVVQFDENKKLIGFRVVENLIQKEKALIRWAGFYFKRSVPIQFS